VGQGAFYLAAGSTAGSLEYRISLVRTAITTCLVLYVLTLGFGAMITPGTSLTFRFVFATVAWAAGSAVIYRQARSAIPRLILDLVPTTNAGTAV
jgi:hypothetical protein